MAALTVPTIFTAVDKLSATVKRMQASVGGFAGKSSIAVNSLNKGLNSLLPSVGGLVKQFGALAGSAALFAGVGFSFKSMMDYDKAIQKLHAQLSDLNTGAFQPYKDQVMAVANATRRSAVDVAGAFNAIALRNHDLVASADGMAKIAEAGILLSKASNMEIIPATDALTSLLTIFKLGAGGANRAVNVLAAGMKYGGASVEEMVESYTKLGPVAQHANLTIEQSTALIGLLAPHLLRGAEAGTALRTVIVRMQKAGLGYRNGLFDINDAMNQSVEIYNRMATAKKKDAFLNQLFGIRGIIGGSVMFENIKGFQQLTKSITGTNEAQSMAAQNTDTLSNRLQELANTWVNYLNGNKKAGEGFMWLKGAIVSVTNNLDKIIDTIKTVIEVFLALKVAIWSAQLIIGIYNTALVVMAWRTGICSAAIEESTFALGLYKAGLSLATISNYLFGTSFGKLTLAAEADAIAIKGVGASATTTAGAFTVAEGAAASFLGVIGRMLGPLGLLLIAYKNIGDIMDHIHDNEPVGAFYGGHQKMTPAGIAASNAAAYKKLQATLHPSAVAASGIRSFAPMRDMKVDSMAAALLPALSSPSVAADTSAKNDPHLIHITVDDKGHIITGIKHNGVPINMPVKVTSTGPLNNKK